MSGYCSDCGKPLIEGAGFCANCGAAVRGNAGAGAAFASSMGSSSSASFAQAPSPVPGDDLSVLDWMLLPLKRYADFSGRSRRKEYWLYYLLNMIVTIVGLLLVVAGVPWDQMNNKYLPPMGISTWIGGMVLILWVLGTFVPSLAVAVRRFHDQDKSGWFYLLAFVPYAGGIILIIFMCLEGTRGANRYGPDPLGNDADIFA